MRKALMSILAAATVLTPVAVQAQRGDAAARYERLERQNQARHAARQSRQEQRQERQAQRPQRQAQRSERQAPRAEAPAPVQVAQRGDRDGRRGDGRRGESRRGNRDRTPSGYQRGWTGPNTPEYRREAERYNRLGRQNAIRYGTPAQRRDAIRDARRDDRRNWRGDRRDDRRSWNNGWRNDRRYDWRGWRNSNRNAFRLGRYYAPYRGWNYRRFSIGLVLQPLFYSQRYWIGNPWQYRLPPAPYGAQWVRYYDDVLLVDTYTGEVIDVIYNFFW